MVEGIAAIGPIFDSTFIIKYRFKLELTSSLSWGLSNYHKIRRDHHKIKYIYRQKGKRTGKRHSTRKKRTGKGQSTRNN